MKSLSSDEICGNWATLLLPLKSDDSIDFKALAEEIDRLINFKVDGIYSNGSAGEFYNQTECEFDQISELLASRCAAAGMPFQIGASHMSPVISLERVRRAAALAPSAIQVILPDWFVPTLDEDAGFLQQLAEVAGTIGLVLYNPPHAKRVLSPAEIGRLSSAVDALVGVKVCDGDEEWYRQIREYCAELSIFVPGHHLATGIRYGAHGAYSNVACLHPGAAQHWYDQMKTDMEGALDLEKRICVFMSEHIVPFIQAGHSNMAVDKLMAAVGGWCPISPRLRRPYRGVEEATVQPLREVVRRIIPEFA